MATNTTAPRPARKYFPRYRLLRAGYSRQAIHQVILMSAGAIRVPQHQQFTFLLANLRRQHAVLDHDIAITQTFVDRLDQAVIVPRFGNEAERPRLVDRIHQGRDVDRTREQDTYRIGLQLLQFAEELD